MYKLILLFSFVVGSNACCGFSLPTISTCCQSSMAYAPPRIIGYERIPLYAKVPVQQVQALSPPAYPVAPIAAAPPVQTYVSNPPVVVQDTQYAGAGIQGGIGQPVIQSVMVQEAPMPMPAYVAATPTTVFVQEVAPRAYPVASAFGITQLAGTNYGGQAIGGNSGLIGNNPGLVGNNPGLVGNAPGVVANNIGGAAGNALNAVDFNAVGVPTAKALKLRRSYLKNVKI